MAKESDAFSEQLTFRVPRDLARRLERAARQMKRRRSDILRISLERFLEDIRTEPPVRPYDLVKDLIGAVDLGIPDLAERHREYLIRRFRGDHPTRS